MGLSVSEQLSALAHERRLDVFQLLMRRYPQAVPAGEIATALDLKPNTTSVYLSTLRQAGLISQTRRGTFQLYQVRMEAVQSMFSTMLGECCRNRPDLCLPVSPPVDRDGPLQVLFLCSHNSARSIMAEALLRAAGPHFAVQSAGTEPASAPNAIALDLLRDQGLATDGLWSKSVTDVLGDLTRVDLVITVCDTAANVDRIAWPGAPIHSHWGIPDPVVDGPVAEQKTRMQEAFHLLQLKINALTAIPLNEIDTVALQSHVDDIGRRHTAPMA